jgi:hypothetical protein
MSALDELRSGQIGPEFVELLGRTIRAVAITRNFPPPDGRVRWDADSICLVISDFIADRQTPRRLADLATVCATEGALRARLQGTVRNFLADLGRRTPIGKLVLRINEVLGKNEAFVRVRNRWALRDGPIEPAVADEDRLRSAIASLPMAIPNWGHEARRSAPVADAPSIVTACEALLRAADGSLHPRILATAIGARLGIGQAPVSADISALDGGSSPGTHSTVSEATRKLRAHEVLEELNDRERLAIAHPEYTVRELAPMLGVSPSKSHLIRRAAVAVLQEELRDDEDAEGVAMQVMDLARQWADSWTTTAGSTY